MKLISNLTGLFVGESSRKREMGLGFALALSVAYVMGYIDYEVYKQLLGFCGLWMGMAFSAKLNKLGNAMKDLKT